VHFFKIVGDFACVLEMLIKMGGILKEQFSLYNLLGPVEWNIFDNSED